MASGEMKNCLYVGNGQRQSKTEWNLGLRCRQPVYEDHILNFKIPRGILSLLLNLHIKRPPVYKDYILLVPRVLFMYRFHLMHNIFMLFPEMPRDMSLVRGSYHHDHGDIQIKQETPDRNSVECEMLPSGSESGAAQRHTGAIQV